MKQAIANPNPKNKDQLKPVSLTDKGEFGGSDFARAFLEARLGIQGDRFIPFTAGHEKLVPVFALDQNQGFPRGVVAQVIVPITVVIGLVFPGKIKSARFFPLSRSCFSSGDESSA